MIENLHQKFYLENKFSIITEWYISKFLDQVNTLLRLDIKKQFELFNNNQINYQDRLLYGSMQVECMQICQKELSDNVHLSNILISYRFNLISLRKYT